MGLTQVRHPVIDEAGRRPASDGGDAISLGIQCVPERVECSEVGRHDDRTLTQGQYPVEDRPIPGHDLEGLRDFIPGLARRGHQVGKVAGAGAEDRASYPGQLGFARPFSYDLPNIRPDIVSIRRGEAVKAFPEEVRDRHPDRPRQEPRQPRHRHSDSDADLAPQLTSRLAAEGSTGAAARRWGVAYGRRFWRCGRCRQIAGDGGHRFGLDAPSFRGGVGCGLLLITRCGRVPETPS